MAKARTITATAVEEPIVEQNIETTSVVEEPQTVSEEPQTVSEEGGNNETTTEGTDTNTPAEGDDNGTTTEGTGEGMQEGDNNDEGDNNEPTTETIDEFIEMTGINKPYAEGIMNLPNAAYYIPVGSGVDLEKRNALIEKLKGDKNETSEGE